MSNEADLVNALRRGLDRQNRGGRKSVNAARERTARELYEAAMPIQDHIDDYWDQLNPGKVERFQNALAAAREAWGWEE